MNFEGLDLLPLPLAVIDGDLNVVFANKSAKGLGDRKKVQKCYSLFFGFDRPCWEVPGYRCPLKEIFDEKKDKSLTVNNYPCGGKFKKFLVETFALGNNLYAEMLLDFEEIEFYEGEENPHHLDKGKIVRLIQEYLDRGKVFTLSLINIKKLKVINQFFGIEVGDAVIQAIEKLLDKYSQKYGFYFAEIAGGYFVVVNDTPQEAAYSIEKELFADIDKLQRIFNLPVKPRISIVSAEITPILTDRAEDIIRIMLYAEKMRTDEEVLFLDTEKLNEILTTLGLKRKVIATLERILKEKRVDIFFQPIVRLDSGEIDYIEELLRVKQGDGYIPIGRYIDLIYELNLTTEFNFQVLEKLREYLPLLEGIRKTVFLNVAAVDLKNQKFQKRLLETIELFKERGINLSLEITEQTLLEEIDFLKFLHETKDLKFAIDDFGTGYSSLKLVIDLISQGVVDILKLDCSLVRSYFENPRARALIQSVVGFTRLLGLETVAECVETKEQAEALKGLGVTHAQGWYFYKPMPVEKLVEIVRKGG